MPLRRRPPAHLTQSLRLEPGERLLSWAAGTAPGQGALASSWGLWVPGVAGRLGWDRIDRASWAPPVLTVVPTDQPAFQLRLARPRDLPAVVRAQVTLAVVVSRRAVLQPGPGVVQVVARRSPRTGEVALDVRYGQGADPARSAAAEAAQRLSREVARDVGA